MSAKNVLITGTTRGLGLALSRCFARRGHRVLGCGRGKRAPGDGAAFFQRADVSVPSDVSALFKRAKEELGDLDVLVNNAGVLAPIVPIERLNVSELQSHLAVNFFGVVNTTQAFLELQKESQSRGVVLNVSSGAAQKGYAGWAAYCASKAALDRFSECLQLEHRDRLLVHAIAPGVVDTDMQQLIRDTDENNFPAREKFVELKNNNAFNSAEFVAEHFVDVAEGKSAYESVVLRLPNEVQND